MQFHTCLNVHTSHVHHMSHTSHHTSHPQEKFKGLDEDISVKMKERVKQGYGFDVCQSVLLPLPTSSLPPPPHPFTLLSPSLTTPSLSILHCPLPHPQPLTPSLLPHSLLLSSSLSIPHPLPHPLPPPPPSPSPPPTLNCFKTTTYFMMFGTVCSVSFNQLHYTTNNTLT